MNLLEEKDNLSARLGTSGDCSMTPGQTCVARCVNHITTRFTCAEARGRYLEQATVVLHGNNTAV